MKSNEGPAAIHMDVYGIFALKKIEVVASVNLLFNLAYYGCNGRKDSLTCNAIIIPDKIV
jgi:hypothetical protein